MIRKTLVGATVLLALAGCSTTVAGTPVADPSALPRPDTGALSTAPRTFGKPTQEEGERLEALRMAATVPYLHEVDPAMHFVGRLDGGSLQSGEATIKKIFGERAATAFAASEVGVMVGARDTANGQKYDAGKRPRGETVSVIRMPSPEAAAAAVSKDLLAADPPVFTGDAPVPKVVTAIPGYPAAIAYTRTYKAMPTQTVAFLAHRQYVLGVYGDLRTEQVKTYFDLQTKGLEGFVPTPRDKVGTLPLDAEGVARYTLAPQGGVGGWSAPARALVLRQSDVARSVKTFADAGVDVIGEGATTVYRARDEKGAQHVRDEFVAETTSTYPGVVAEKVKGVPGGTCLTYPAYPGASRTTTLCLAAVGRYLAEVSGPQKQDAVQKLGASYLILQKAK